MLTLLLATFLFQTENRPARACAMVLDVKGKPLRTASGTDRLVRIRDVLRLGDQLVCDAKSSVTLMIESDGHLEELKPGVAVVVGSSGCTPVDKVSRRPPPLKDGLTDAVRNQLRTGRIAATVARSDGTTPPAIAPVDGTIILSDRPSLRWPNAPKAKGYRVEMLNGAEGAAERILWTALTKTNDLPYPKDKPGLKRTLKYRWRITAILDDEDEVAVLTGQFLIGREETAKEAAQLTQLAASNDTSDLVLAAVGFESLGLLDPLFPLYQKLAKHFPNDPNVLRLLAEAAFKAGQRGDAEAALRKAKHLSGEATKP